MSDILSSLAGICEVRENELMSAHTTFRIGGAADYFLTPSNIAELQAAQMVLREQGVPVFILGNGSNLLVGDDGISGAVIYTGGMNKVTVDGDVIHAELGAKLSDVCRTAQVNALSGLEFAFGIPGSVGGGVFMNAGAYGGELKDVVTSVTVLTSEGRIITLTSEECDFGYRTSRFGRENEIVISADFTLTKGDRDAIKSLMDETLAKRRAKQPLEHPSAGSVFRRPEGNYAGTLIENAGLKGRTVGGAQVSVKHAGFIINIGNATCADVTTLIGIITDEVYAKSGVQLECEIRKTGR